jgi:Doubled CXXCH motif (Paired_CXXCH_1)
MTTKQIQQPVYETVCDRCHEIIPDISVSYRMSYGKFTAPMNDADLCYRCHGNLVAWLEGCVYARRG